MDRLTTSSDTEELDVSAPVAGVLVAEVLKYTVPLKSECLVMSVTPPLELLVDVIVTETPVISFEEATAILIYAPASFFNCIQGRLAASV